MKKKIIFMLTAVVLLAALIAVYFYVANKPEEIQEPDPVEENKLFDKESKELVEIEITSGENSMILKREDEGWILPDFPDVKIDKSKPDSMAYTVSSLSSDQIIENDSDDLSSLGLDPPNITVTGRFQDQSENRLLIGNPTPSLDKYYIMVENDDQIYLLSKYSAENFQLTALELTDQNLDIPQANMLTYIEFTQKDKDRVLMTLDERFTEDELTESQNMGAAPLVMIEPIQSDSLNSYYFDEQFLAILPSIKVDQTLALVRGSDEEYGFDHPVYELTLKDAEKTFGMKVGNYIAETDSAYLKIEGRQELFSIKQDTVNRLNASNALKFVLRFIDLPNIDTVDSFKITAAGEEHIALLNRRTEKAEEEDQEDTVIIEPTMDGVAVEDDAFRLFYRIVIGLTYDVVVDKDIQLSGDPAVIVEFTLLDNVPGNTSKFYEYNENFYIVEQNGKISDIVSKQAVDAMVDSIETLKDGTLKQD